MDILTDFEGMARTFPLMRGGGALLVLVGLGLVVGGAAGRRWLLPSLITGAALAILVMMIGGITKTIFDGLGYPAIYQYVAFGLGVVAEVGGLLVPELPYRVLWVTDGVLKIAAGSTMVWLSY